MPIVLRPTQGEVTESTYALITHNSGSWVASCSGPHKSDAITSVTFTLKTLLKVLLSLVEERGVETLVLEVPVGEAQEFAEVLGEVALSWNWGASCLKEIQVHSSTPEDFNTVNAYFQGYWHL